MKEELNNLEERVKAVDFFTDEEILNLRKVSLFIDRTAKFVEGTRIGVLTLAKVVKLVVVVLATIAAGLTAYSTIINWNLGG